VRFFPLQAIDTTRVHVADAACDLAVLGLVFRVERKIPPPARAAFSSPPIAT
jgi:hypothetical protein